MSAIVRRELGSYFGSPIGYVYLCIFYLFSGVFFAIYSIVSANSSLMSTFSMLTTISWFLIPILTMRLFSEEKKNKTDQALLTSPVSLTGIVLGKFFAALLVFILGLLITLVFAVFIAFFTVPDWTQIFASFLAMLLMGAALIAIGMFISSLTENQVIAAIGGFAVAFGLIFLETFTNMAQNDTLRGVLSGVSFYSRYTTFTSGLFDFSGVLYFISVCFLFCFFTVRVLEKRRWS